METRDAAREAEGQIRVVEVPPSDIILFHMLHERLPEYDPAWPEEWRAIWHRAFAMILDIMDRMHAASALPTPPAGGANG